MAEKIKCDCGITFNAEEDQTHCNYCGIKLSDIGKEKPERKVGLFYQKAEEPSQKVLEEYGLDIDSYDMDRIKKENSNNLKQIARDIMANKWFKAGLALSFASADKQATVGYLSAIVNQNWILIRQNELIIRLLGGKSKKE